MLGSVAWEGEVLDELQDGDDGDTVVCGAVTGGHAVDVGVDESAGAEGGGVEAERLRVVGAGDVDEEIRALEVDGVAEQKNRIADLDVRV